MARRVMGEVKKDRCNWVAVEYKFRPCSRCQREFKPESKFNTRCQSCHASESKVSGKEFKLRTLALA